MSGNSGGPVVTRLVCSITFAREAAGALGARHSPRPHGRRIQARPGRIAPRDRGIVCRRHCEERSDETIHFTTPRYGLLRGACHRARIRATRWLAMTVAPLSHSVIVK